MVRLLWIGDSCGETAAPDAAPSQCTIQALFYTDPIVSDITSLDAENMPPGCSSYAALNLP